MKPDAADAALDLDELAGLWTDLNAARDRGTSRPWKERPQDVDDHGRRIPLAADPTCGVCGGELQRRTRELDDGSVVLDGRPYCPRGCPVALAGTSGQTQAREDVIDVITDITPAALELEEEMREYLGEPLARHDERPFLVTPRPSSETEVRIVAARHDTPAQFFDDDGEPISGYAPGAWASAQVGVGDVDTRVPAALRWLARHASRITDPDKLEHLCREARRMCQAARRALGTGERVQKLKSPCPICGLLSLIVFFDRCPPEYQPCNKRDCDPLRHGLIVCTANTPPRADDPDGIDRPEPPCQCDLDDCPFRCHEGYRHRWPGADWERLLLVVTEGS